MPISISKNKNCTFKIAVRRKFPFSFRTAPETVLLNKIILKCLPATDTNKKMLIECDTSMNNSSSSLIKKNIRHVCRIPYYYFQLYYCRWWGENWMTHRILKSGKYSYIKVFGAKVTS